MSRRLGVFLLCLLPSAAFAADSLGVAAPSAPEAALLVGADPVIVFRAPILVGVPARRVETARDRIDGLRTSQLYQPVHVEPFESGYAVLAGETFLFGVSSGDADTTAHLSAGAVANRAAARLQAALRERARSLTPAARGWAIAAVVLATLALALALRSLGWIRQRALARLGGKGRGGRFGSFDLLSQFSVAIAWAARLLTQVGGIALAGIWLIFVMNRFPETQPWGFAARGAVFGILKDFQVALFRALPDLVAVALIFFAARFLVQVLSDLFRSVEAGTIRIPAIHPETASATRRLVTALVWLLAIVVAYPFVPGSGSTAFKGVSVFLGVLATLGSSGVVGHMVSGLVLVYSRALRAGDFVRIGDVEGTVREVGTLSVKLSNFRDEEFTIPNTVIVGTTVRNYTRLGHREGGGLSATVMVGYDAPWRVVHEMLQKAAAATTGLHREPPPIIYQTALGKFAVEYQLVVRLEPGVTRVHVLSQLHQNILDAFNERGVQIMVPEFETQPDRPVVVPRERWSHAPLDGA